LYLQTSTDYTVLVDDDGAVVYADLGGDGFLHPTSDRVGNVDPKKSRHKKGQKVKAKKDCKKQMCDGDGDPKGKVKGQGGKLRKPTKGVKGGDSKHRRTAHTTGNLKNLVVLLEFSDHTPRNVPSMEEIDILMNHDGPHSLCPTGSVKDVFLENSYGKLVLESVVTDWVTLPRSEAHYAGGYSG
jgi:hypothetical protein